MGRPDIGTAKYQSKQLKASGLQKLKFYCQICEKQCRDSNGFKNHLNSPSHLGRIENLAKTNKDVVKEYSNEFERDFLKLLRINHGTKAINANKFYQEYILNDKNHIHMNTTKWNSLTLFIKHLGQCGLVKVEKETGNDDEEFNLSIKLVDPTDQNPLKNTKADNEEKSRMKFINNQIKLGKQQEEEKQQQQKPQCEPENKPQENINEPVKPIKLNLKRAGPKTTTRPSIFE